MQLVQTWWNYTSAYKLSTVNTKMYWHRYVWPRISCITNLLPSLTLINDHITDLQRKYRQQTFTQTRVKYIPIISPECLQQIHNRSDYLPKLGHSAPVTLRYLIQKKSSICGLSHEAGYKVCAFMRLDHLKADSLYFVIYTRVLRTCSGDSVWWYW